MFVVVVNISTAKYKEKTCLCLWKMEEFSRQEQQKKEHENIMIINHIIIIMRGVNCVACTEVDNPDASDAFAGAQNKENFEQGLLLFSFYFHSLFFFLELSKCLSSEIHLPHRPAP